MPQLKPPRIVALYAVVSALWILFSDNAASLLFSSSPEALLWANTLKGWFYVIVVSCMLWLLLKRFEKQTTRQISEREIAEEHLRHNEIMLEYILNTVPQKIFWKDKNSVYLGCNKAFARVAGKETQAEVVGKTDYELPWLTEESDAYRADDRAVMDSGQPKQHIIEQQLQADGERRWVDTSKFPMLDHHCQVFGVLGIYDDITERKCAEEALRVSEARYRRLHESIMDAFISFDMAGNIQECNTACKLMLGYTDEELPGLTNDDLTPARWREMESDIVKDQVLSRGYSELYEKELRHKDGDPFPVELRTYLLRRDDGSPAGMWAVVRDISERKRLQEAMIQSEKMMSVGGLAAGMAHEINNPLGGILQSAQVMASRLGEELPANLAEAKQVGCELGAIHAYLENRGIFTMLSGIRDSATRAARIVANMLEFSRRSHSDFTRENINAILDNAVELASNDYDLKKRFDFRAIRIDKDFAHDLPLVKCSPQEIEQVMLNLLKNAAQAMAGWDKWPEDPSIRLRTSHEDGRVRIEVSDNGPGMPPEVARHVFEPFFTTKEPGQGTGLGLSVSYFIITGHHGGSISLDTEPGKGARFLIDLPV